MVLRQKGTRAFRNSREALWLELHEQEGDEDRNEVRKGHCQIMQGFMGPVRTSDSVLDDGSVLV
jgi:hypothetical protein